MFVYLYLQEPPGGEGGKDPEFSITLVDNGENDYIDVQYIKAGTGFARTPDPLPLQGVEIEIGPMENFYELFIIRFPPGELHTGENTRAFFNADLVERGKFYRVFLNFYGERENFRPDLVMDYIENIKCE